MDERDGRGRSIGGGAAGEGDPTGEVAASARLQAAVRRLAAVAGTPPDAALHAAAEALDPDAPLDDRALAAVLARAWAPSPPARIGLAGAQGTGKTTLARLLARALTQQGLRAAVLALDDYYLSRADRAGLARRVHPLFETRGPPGTHDVARLHRDLVSLADAVRVEAPIFDKGLDEPIGTRPLEGPFDVVVLEGWCIGARPEDEARLARPCNALERDEDVDGTWRRFANERLATDYAALFRTLSTEVFLRAPDLAAIRRWRLLQEQALPAAQRKDAASIARFVEHFERISLSMRRSATTHADWTIRLAPDHSIAGIERRRRDASGGAPGEA